MPALHPSTAVDAREPARAASRPVLHLQPALPAPARMRNVRAALLIVAGLALVVVAMFLWWPAGVVIGLVLGVAVVLALGGAQQHAAVDVPVDHDLAALFGGSVVLARVGEAPARPSSVALTAVPARRTAVPEAEAEAEPAPEREPQRVFALPAAEHPVVAEAIAVVEPAVEEPAPAPRPVVAPAAVAKAAPAKPAAGVRADLGRLKADLGDDWPDFARAARLVVSTQYASAARLQRDLQLPYSRARRLLADLESEHFVGPATGTLPRQVLVQKERLPEVERLFAGV